MRLTGIKARNLAVLYLASPTPGTNILGKVIDKKREETSPDPQQAPGAAPIGGVFP